MTVSLPPSSPFSPSSVHSSPLSSRQVHGTTELITSSRRPVPLSWHVSSRAALLPLLNPAGTAINP